MPTHKNKTRTKKRIFILAGLTSITALLTTTTVVNTNSIKVESSPNYLNTNYSRSVNSVYGDHKLIKDVKHQLIASKKVADNDVKNKANANSERKGKE